MNDLWQLLTKVFGRGKVPMKEKKTSKKDRLSELEQMVSSQAENIKNLTKELSELKRNPLKLIAEDAYGIATRLGIFEGTRDEFIEALKSE
jgi:predicted RNase H-like nuclease (RuvC/YqgF family)